MTEVLYEYDYDDMLQIDLDNFYQFEHLFNDTEGINVSRITLSRAGKSELNSESLRLKWILKFSTNLFFLILFQNHLK